MLKAETCPFTSVEGVLPEISKSNSGNARKVYAAELVANTAQLVDGPNRTIHTRKVCIAVLVRTGSTTDRMDLERY